MRRFRADLLPVPHGGHYVVVPPAVAEKEGLVHHSRVRGTCNGVPYRVLDAKKPETRALRLAKTIARLRGVGSGKK